MRMYQQQKQSCSSQPFWRSEFDKLPDIFCVHCRSDAEGCVQQALCEADDDLRNMWCNMRNAFQWFIVPPVALGADAPQAGADAAEVRAWMNNPANQPVLDKLKYLFLGRGDDPVIEWFAVYAIPPEIVKCRNLTTLQLREVEELPPFLADLRYLQLIYDSSLEQDRSAVTHISDRVYRHMERSLPLGANDIVLDESRLKEIPFRKWFNESVRLSHVSLTDAVLKFGEENDLDCAGDCSFLILCPLAFLLEIPAQIAIFFYNLFVTDIIEPIITCARDLLGHSRMVKVGEER
jgi:hypothetical protein